MEELKDIKAIEIIQIDFSFYFIMISLFIIVFSIALYLLGKKQTKLNTKQKAIIKLKNIDFTSNDFKKIAYTFTINGKLSLEEDKKDIFYNILKQLERYKYTKENSNIDINLLKQMQQYIKDQE